MKINKIVVQNYKSLAKTAVNFPEKIGVIVGDNEVGKSSLLEAIGLALTSQLNGRHVAYELHPFLFNTDAVGEYLASLQEGNKVYPPRILVELYFDESDELAHLKGSINSTGEDTAGVSFSVEFDGKYEDEYANFIADPAQVTSVPIEYMKIVWRSFADHDITARSIPLKCSMIDASAVRNDLGASRYVTDLMASYLEPAELAKLGLSYRKMKDQFLDDPSIKSINGELSKATGTVSDKQLTIGLDNTARAKWEAGIMPHLDAIPFPLVGKGEQTSTKIKLALEKSNGKRALLVEEPENHLSHTNLNSLLTSMFEKSEDNQMIVSTHSSFVLNKLGLDGTILFDGSTGVTLSDLPEDTRDYFLKLSGHDTLRLILAKRAILVEGPSDELIVQKAYFHKHGMLPIADGTEVISVRSLAFKRFLEIAKLLGVDVRVVTDNDGDVEKLENKYADYADIASISVHYDNDETIPTLEPQLLKSNGLAKTNEILGTEFKTEEEIVAHMVGAKTDCALKFFNHPEPFEVPEYINNAITK